MGKKKSKKKGKHYKNKRKHQAQKNFSTNKQQSVSAKKQIDEDTVKKEENLQTTMPKEKKSIFSFFKHKKEMCAQKGDVLENSSTETIETPNEMELEKTSSSEPIENSEETISKDIENFEETISKDIENAEETISKGIENSEEMITEDIENSEKNTDEVETPLEQPKEKKFFRNLFKNEKQNLTKNKKKLILIGSSVTFLVILGIILWYLVAFVFVVKSKYQIEAGTKTELLPSEFLNYATSGEITFVTDFSTIDLAKVGEYDIELSLNNQIYHSKLLLVDTTSPVVEFRNWDAYTNYVFNAEDFIVSKSDVSEMTVEAENIPEINGFKEYPITIIVKDCAGNETIGNVVLSTSYIKKDFTLELGNKLSYSDLLLNPDADKDVIPQSELDRINSSPIGEYEITTSNDGVEVTTKILVQDTLAPVLAVKDVTIYNDQKSLDKSAFIESVSDASEYTVELKTDIPYTQVGTYDIELEAKDVIGNTITQVAKLNIIKDTVGPVFYGLNALSVSKNANVNWNKGVSARDAKDGNCTFTVSSSSVNLSVAGTYSATYTSKDKSGNTTKKSRTVVVNPDASDVYAKASEWLSKYGRDPISIKNAVSSHIKYSTATNRSSLWGAWMGLSTLRGDCYVHAATTNLLLQKAGYSCRIVNSTDNSHFWNLVKVGDVWRHLDSTPPTYSQNGLMTDEERYATLRGKNWNRDAFPKAE